MHFMKVVHDRAGTGRVDPAVGPWTHGGAGQIAQLNHPGSPLVTMGCSQVGSVTITATNLGDAHLSSSEIWIVLSADSQYSTSDIVANSGINFWGDSGFWTTGTIPFAIPPGTPAGTYRVAVLIDPQNVLLEDNEGNNATYTGLRVRVNTGC